MTVILELSINASLISLFQVYLRPAKNATFLPHLLANLPHILAHVHFW